MRELEAAETAAFRDFYSTAPGEVHEAGGATCLVARSVPVPWMNRVAGLGVGRPATADDVEAVKRVYGGIAHSVAASRLAQPSDLGRLLERHGYAPGYAWMRFRRDVEPQATRPTALTVREAGAADGPAFAHVVLGAFGFPAELAPLLEALPGRRPWRIFLAEDGGAPVGAGALFLHGKVGWLGFGATLEAARGRGSQSAIFRARIEAARAAGATALTTETGVRQEGRPERSYRNILRAGFEEAGERPNYVFS